MAMHMEVSNTGGNCGISRMKPLWAVSGYWKVMYFGITTPVIHYFPITAHSITVYSFIISTSGFLISHPG